MGQDEEDAAFCEKIINEIDAVFVRDPELIGFEIIPMPLNQNKSPVIHVEHNLGLQSWCVEFIYAYAHRLILQYRNEWLASNALPVSCGTGCWMASEKGKLGGCLHSGGSGGNAGNGASVPIIKYLNCAILINPDVATFWNLRRQLFAKNRLDISREFHFSALVLSKKPKSNEAFAYRRWLYLFQSYDAIDWSFEISLCEKSADKSNTNYHAWCHRQWVLMKAPQLLKYEVYKTEKFIRKHIHDYSCYNHRQFVLAKMFELCYFDDEDDDDDDDDGGEGSASGSTEPATRKRRKYDALCTLIESLTGSPAPTVVPSQDATVHGLLRYLIPAITKEQLELLSQLRVQTFLYCLNQAAYDLRMCVELCALHSVSQALENHRKFMVKFLIDRLRHAPGWLLRAADEAYPGPSGTGCQQPLSKITRLDEDASELLQALKVDELRRAQADPRHAQWCKSFLGIESEQ
ncbi:protein prenyltransferase alpha subunit repeat-containing protein 1 [Anopheles ziemanni]|uniref:protein prenyltransferase alpha subunit repeat-containing protein 1 n=1 Tax=Anopheles coustani TaxID=139045 RepID=UPI00265A4CD9|nr:protein prenyltransferase alpha subunit repeat-containing protein 1 [Anopheles coustani]XP_058171849.1 protein prenyltransferase alpha subunit repeat-containing protein 1 [Anopheles ziemanni]